MTDFESFGLAEPIARAISGAGYSTPTPIQAQTIPLTLEGRDVLGIAQTGTGKTLAFAAPILDQLARKKGPAPKRGTRALILAPTRELASQIAQSFEDYGSEMRLRILTVFGGVKINKQIRELERGAHVLVATPGRLLDLIDRGSLQLGDVETLVLDEADQMMDLGFIHSLRKIVPLVPKERQTLFFSATMPKQIADLAAKYLRNPAEVSVTPVSTTAERVDQSVIFVPQRAKQALLAHMLKQPDVANALIFTRTKHGADKVVRQLARDGLDAVAIHGNKSQPQRRKALDAFSSGEVLFMVATDIAARGIDISGLSHVVNFDVPNVPEQYVHRIGRTGRAGASGKALSFVAPDEKPYLRDIQRLTGVKPDVLPVPDGLELPEPASDDGGDGARAKSQGGGQRKPRAGGDAKQGGQKRNRRRPRNKAGQGGAPQGNRSQGGRPQKGENRNAKRGQA